MLAMLKSVITSMATSLLTKEFLEWLLLYVAELLVKSTKTPYDDRLLKKIKEALGVG